MEIKSGSEWIDDKSGLGVVVDSIIAAASEETKVVYKLFDNTGNYLGYNSCTYEAFLDSKTPIAYGYECLYSKGYEHGVQHMKMQYSIDKYLDMSDKLSLTEDEVDNIIDDAFEEGYAQAYSELQTNTERERVLQEKAWDEGYSQAISDVIDGDFEDDYSEYEFGAVEDDEEESCFSKELYKILNGDFVVGNKSDDVERKHSHYFKDVRHLDYVDIYQVCKLFEVDDSSHCTQHSIKKLLMSGKRGAKDKIKDITEARDTLSRYLQIEGYE